MLTNTLTISLVIAIVVVVGFLRPKGSPHHRHLQITQDILTTMAETSNLADTPLQTKVTIAET